MGLGLVTKKIAEWMRENEDEYLLEKCERLGSNSDLKTGMNLVVKLIEENPAKRFSYDLQTAGLSVG